MQSTAPRAPQSSVPLSASPRSLAAAFAHAPDPRRQSSVTDALSAHLTWAVAAILANHLSVRASAAWDARQSPALLRTLGFSQGRTPAQSTVQRVCSTLDGPARAAALGAHFAPTVLARPAEAHTQGVAGDGKAQRGPLPLQDGDCPVHALTAFRHEHGVVLAPQPIAHGADTGPTQARPR